MEYACLACSFEQLTNTHKQFESEQHTCEIGTGTTKSGSSASAYTFDNYQDDTGVTAIYPDAGTKSISAINYCVLGLIGEAGEIANVWKKYYRDRNKFDATEDQSKFEFYQTWIKHELGDVLWYASQLATELGTSLGEVAADNIRKLNDRKQRGKLSGSGDGR